MWIEIKSSDGKTFRAYTAKPASQKAPAVVVVQEMFGISKWLRSYVDSLAEAGYFAVAPDLYHRQEPGLELDDKNQADYDKALSLYKSFNADEGVRDLIATLGAVRSMPECNGQAATVGFCLGGKLSFLMSSRSDAQCNVGFYATGINQLLDEKISTPLLLHIPTEDAIVPPDAQRQIHHALDGNANVTIYDYAGAGHAFMRTSGPHYNKEFAQLAAQRTLEYLKAHLSAKSAVR